MLSILLTLPLLGLSALAEPHGRGGFQRHHEIAKRAPSDVHLYEKRFSGARWSFYEAGLGACGGTNSEADFIVALNSEQYGGGYPGPQCFKMITMTYNGKTATAQIVDECPGCPYGGLDLTKGLFTHFASEDEGIIYGEWSFQDGSGGGGDQTTTKEPETTKETWTWSPDPTTSKTKTKTTKTWTPEPTTTWTPEPTSTWSSSSEEEWTTTSSKTKTKTKTSTWSEPTSTSEWSSSSSASSSAEPTSSATPSSSSASSSAAASASVAVSGGIELLGQAIMGMGNMMINVADA